MCEIVLQCVAREYNDKELAFRDVMRLGRELIITADWQYQMVDPLDERAYLASAKEFLQFFSSIPSDKLSKYKNEILDERFCAEEKRVDRNIDLGIGERERFSIGISESSIMDYCDEMFWKDINQYGDYIIFDNQEDMSRFGETPLLVIKKSERVDLIENYLKTFEITIQEALNSIEDISEIIGNPEIENIESLIEDTRKARNCGICEAVAESVFRLLEGWCIKQVH